MDLRHELSLPLQDCLSLGHAFSLFPNVDVVSHRELDIDARFKEHFVGGRSSNWSGMCVPYPNGITLVIYNTDHPERRTRATLMEEFFHLWLGHPHDRLRLLSDGEGRREYHSGKESEAYGSGAAALVPYKSLKAMLTDGKTARQVADHFLVSEALVEFRIRVSKLKGLRGM